MNDRLRKKINSLGAPLMFDKYVDEYLNVDKSMTDVSLAFIGRKSASLDKGHGECVKPMDR